VETGKLRPDGRVPLGNFRAPLVAVAYPLLLVGFATRYYAAKLDSAVARFGVLGAVIVATVVWGSLTLLALPTADRPR